MIEVQSFQCMVSTYSMTRSLSGKFGSKHRFFFRETTGFVGSNDKGVVGFTGDGQKFRHINWG